MGRAEDIFNKIVEGDISAINKFLEQAVSEELFLDFKLSSDRGTNARLSDIDRANFGEAISGFGNSEGGVIVWGVACSKKSNGADVPHSKQPIDNPERFRSWLEGDVSGRTLPPHPNVRSHVINTGNGAGYVVSLIMKSNYAPHREIKTQHYYMRAGSSFMKVPHDVLSGMFGKRPQAQIEYKFVVKPAVVSQRPAGFIAHAEITLRNAGMGIARDVFINAGVVTEIGPKSILKLIPGRDEIWSPRLEYSVSFVGVTRDDFKLPPTALLPALTLELTVHPPFDNNLYLKVSCGSDGSETTHFELVSSKDTVQKAYDEYLEKASKNQLTEKDKWEFSRVVFGIPEAQ